MKKPKISMQAPTIARGQMGFPCLASNTALPDPRVEPFGADQRLVGHAT
jgi:hypothetical protein